jgi:hypothetical protein
MVAVGTALGCDPVHSFPVDPGFLAAAPQRPPPVPGYQETEGRHCLDAAGHGVVRHMPAHHAGQPAALLRNGQVHALRELVFDLFQLRRDHDRYLAEAATRLARRLNATVRELVRGSLRDGHEHAADFAGFRLGIIVRAEDGHETYVAIRITGSVHQNLTTTILSRVPGCAPDAWFPEYALPERELLPAEQAWSNIMDPKAAAQLLEEQP